MSSSEVDENAVGLGPRIGALLDAFEAEGNRHSWEFLATGPAATDWILEFDVPGLGSQPLQDAYRTSSVLRPLIVDEARALVILLEHGQLTYAALTLARTLAEASARCWYLLEIGLSRNERVRRLTNDRLHMLFEEERLQAGLPGADAQWINMRRAEILGAVQVMEWKLEDQKGRNTAEAIHPGRPSTMALLGLLLENRKLADLFYRTTSGIVHVGLQSVVKFMELSDPEVSDRLRMRQAVLSPQEVAINLFPALMAMGACLRVFAFQMGWDARDIDRKYSELMSALETLLG